MGCAGVLLIYSLLLNDVEEKTYEYGMLRALGFRQRSLIQVRVQPPPGNNNARWRWRWRWRGAVTVFGVVSVECERCVCLCSFWAPSR